MTFVNYTLNFLFITGKMLQVCTYFLYFNASKKDLVYDSM